MSASIGGGNFGNNASSMGGRGNMSSQEMRGSGGLLGNNIASKFKGYSPEGQNAPMWPGGIHVSDEMLAKASEYLEALGWKSLLPKPGQGGSGDGSSGGGIGTPGGATGGGSGGQPAPWAFPQYTQGWLPPTPPVPPMIPTPPFKRK